MFTVYHEIYHASAHVTVAIVLHRYIVHEASYVHKRLGAGITVCNTCTGVTLLIVTLVVGHMHGWLIITERSDSHSVSAVK